MAESANGATPTDELNLFLIVYELVGRLNGTRPSNLDLRRELEGYPAKTQLTDSAWVVRTPRSVTGVFDAIDRHLEPDDRLFVASLTGEAAWRNLERGYEWLQEAFEPGGPLEGRAA